MAKKYLSLEEAASLLGISVDDVRRAREKGDLRGFQDRGSWKFREQDIDEFRRSQQADSSPDMPMLSADGAIDLASSDSDVRLMADPADDDLGDLVGGPRVDVGPLDVDGVHVVVELVDVAVRQLLDTDAGGDHLIDHIVQPREVMDAAAGFAPRPARLQPRPLRAQRGQIGVGLLGQIHATVEALHADADA